MQIDFSSILNSEELSLLERTRRTFKIKKNQLLFMEGKEPAGAYFLFKGKIKIFTTDAKGREQIVHLAKPGNILGYRALLGDDCFSCSASALEDSEAWFIPKETFLVFLRIMQPSPTL